MPYAYTVLLLCLLGGFFAGLFLGLFLVRLLDKYYFDLLVLFDLLDLLLLILN